jgi:glutamyl-tRNA reductase
MLGSRRRALLTCIKPLAAVHGAMQPIRFSHSPEEARRLELERALRQLQSGKDPETVLLVLSRRLMNKILHPAAAAQEGNRALTPIS